MSYLNFKEYSQKSESVFRIKKVPTVKMLTKEKESLQKLYDEKNAEYITAKKEADRLSKLIQTKQQSQKALEQYLQNEQAAKQKKKQSLE